MWLSSAAIAVVVTLQAPGRIVPETKLDVLLDPITYLGRALTAWDPSAGFGRVQNQAVGYVFPMGAFTTVGQQLAVPPWLVQRLWISLVLVVSLWGAHRIARAVGIASAGGRLAAAWAYALAPATLSVAAFQSAGQLPYALAPWVLVPLLTAPDGASPRRTAARSALWIAAMGGVNGASAFAVLPLVLIWFATRAPGPARRRLFAWWSAGAIAATLWWIIPLLVSIRYGLRFTEYTEQASLTTWTESGTEILRGTGNWLAFVQTDAGPWLPGGWALSADRLAVAATTAVAAAGLAGLARRDAPGRAWLLPSFVLGATVMGVGYAGAWGGPFDGVAQQLLDGPLVPFRNVHKFAAVARLPLALGFGHLVAVAAGAVARSARASALDRARRIDVESTRTTAGWRVLAVPAIALVLVGLSIAPAANGQLTAPGSFEDIPTGWRQAGAWLESRDDGGRALLLPGSAFGEYRWGRPLDEPLASIQGTPWAVRDLIPLGGNGSTRLLDAVDTALQSDALPPGFVTALQRAGVRYLVVRNDLDRVRTGGPSPASVRRLLATAPELSVVASFGPVQTDTTGDRRISATPGASAADEFRAIDIYEVPDPVDRATAYPAAEAAVTSGGPEAVLDLEPELTDGRAVVLAVDDGAADLPDPVRVATDTARRRDVRFGSIRSNVSYTLTDDQVGPLSGTAPVDRWPSGAPTGLTSARVDGAASITDSRRPQQSLRPEQQPYHAFDGNPSTAWGPATARVGEWVEVRFDDAIDARTATIRIPETTGERIGRVAVETDAGSVQGTLGPDGSVTVDLPDGATRSLRVTIDDLVGVRSVARVGISEIEIDGVDIRRPLVVPSPGGDGADVVNLVRDRNDRYSLVRRDEQAELDREFGWGGSREAVVRGTASAAPGDALDALLRTASDPSTEGAITVSATSQLRRLPALAPAAVLDGDPRTAWVSEPEAGTPAITLRWDGLLPVDAIDIVVPPGVGDPVDRVVVTAAGTSFERPLDATGRVTIPSTTTDEITVAFPRRSDDLTGARQVAVAEIEVPALLGRAAVLPDRDRPIELACGDGPPVTLDGEVVPTRAETTAGALIDGDPVAWEACDPVELQPGAHRVSATAEALLVTALVIEPVGGVAAPPPGRAIDIGAWGSDARRIEIGAGDAAVLATTENLNDGWEATLDGDVLTPIRVDGWRQGWQVPAGAAGTVELRYRPAAVQRAGLALGLGVLVLLVAAATIRPRRRDDAAAPSGLPLGERGWGAAPAWGLAVVAGLALGGPLVLVAVPLALIRHRDRWLPVVAAAAMGAAGAVAFAGAGADVGEVTGTFSGPAQAFAVTAVVAVALALLPASDQPAT
jgi:arabinofuranan 3-O-arabinosyltransferase